MGFLPGWNSIETTAWFHDLFEKSSLVLGVILAVALALAYLYGHRRDELSDDVARTAKAPTYAAPITEKTSVNPRLTPSPEIHSPLAANRPTIEEKPPPDAEAQAPTARPLAPPPNQTLSGEKKLAAVEAPVAKPLPPPVESPAPVTQETPRVQDERGTPVVTPHAVPKEQPAQVRAEDATNRISAEPDKPQGPRRLSAEQKSRLHASLKDQPKGRLVVRINPAVPDAANYGVELARFFKHDAGWPVRIDNSPFTSADLGGMWLALRSPDAVPPATGTLHAALAHAHVPVRPQPVWDLGGPAFNEIWLVIGKRH